MTVPTHLPLSSLSQTKNPPIAARTSCDDKRRFLIPLNGTPKNLTRTEMASRGPASKDSILPAISFTREPAACSTIHIPPLITLIKVSSSKFLIVV